METSVHNAFVTSQNQNIEQKKPKKVVLLQIISIQTQTYNIWPFSRLIIFLTTIFKRQKDKKQIMVLNVTFKQLSFASQRL